MLVARCLIVAGGGCHIIDHVEREGGGSRERRFIYKNKPKATAIKRPAMPAPLVIFVAPLDDALG